MATFILIPGAGGDGSYWHAVAPLLEAAGHEVFAVTLPAADPTADLDAYAEVILTAIGAARDPHPVLVAQSLGGQSAVRVAERSTPRLLVFVNAMIPSPGESAGAWWSATGQGPASRAFALEQGRDPDVPFDPVEVFFHDLPPAALAAALDRGPGPGQSDAAFAGHWEASAYPDVPVRVIAGTRDRLFPYTFQVRLAAQRLGPDVRVDAIDAGHLPALSRPAELAALLMSYVGP